MPEIMDPTAKDLEDLLKSLQLPTISSTSSPSNPTLTPSELDLISTALAPHSSSSPQSKSTPNNRSRALAYLILSQTLRPPPSPNNPTPSTSPFTPYLLSALSQTSFPPLHRALSLFSALFQVDATFAGTVLQADGVIEVLGEVLDLEGFTRDVDPHLDNTIASAVGGDEGDEDESQEVLKARLDLAIATFISDSTSSPPTRSLINTLASDWLEIQISRPALSAPNSSSDRNEDVAVELELVRGLRERVKMIAAVALTKLLRAREIDPLLGQSEGTTPESSGSGAERRDVGKLRGEIEELGGMFSRMVVAGGGGGGEEEILPALEGLAYTSAQSAVKDRLTADPTFLKSLFNLSKALTTTKSNLSTSRQTQLSASYSYNPDLDPDNTQNGPLNPSTAQPFIITTILLNLFSRRPVLTPEQKQVLKLKKLAGAGKAGKTLKASSEEVSPSGVDDDPRESNEAVEERIQLGLKQGLVEALVGMGKVDSLRVKAGVGKVFLEVVTEQGNRLGVVRDGGVRALRGVIDALLDVGQKDTKTMSSEEAMAAISADTLPAIQAFAKLIITLPPTTLFTPQPTTPAIDSIRPLSTLLLHPSSLLIQRFEALMALTNIASISAEVAARIVSWGDKPGEIVRKAEGEVLEENVLVRRAGVELICNLINCEEGFCRYSGDTVGDDEENNGKEKEKKGNKAAASRLHILLAMTNVYDLSTRLAASGALATLSQSPTACSLLLGLGGSSTGGKVWEMVDDMLAPPRVKPDDDEDGGQDEEEVEEVSTLTPDAGLVHRAIIFLVNLLSYVNTLGPAEKKAGLVEADKAGVTKRLLGLLGTWTDKTSTTHPGMEVVEAAVECLRIMKEGGIKLVP